MNNRPKYRISLSNGAGELDAIETNVPGIMLSEVLRQTLLTDWKYISPGDVIRVTDNREG